MSELVLWQLSEAIRLHKADNILGLLQDAYDVIYILREQPKREKEG